MKLRTKLLALLLCTAMLLSLLPAGTLQASAYSETDIAYPVEGGNIYFDKATGTITDCDNTVTSADIPNEIDGVAVTTIDNYAFYSCDSLMSVTIGDSVMTIGYAAFEYCDSLTSFWVDEANLYYSSDASGVLFNKEKSELILCPDGFSGLYVIPDSVTTIGDDAFSRCSSLTSVTIPDSVTSIGDYAFEYCDSLTNLTIGDSVTSIGDYAFEYCDSLTNLTIGDSVTSIGKSAFSGCTSLTSVTIPDSVTTIGFGPFSGCDSLTGIWVDEANPNYSSDTCGVLFNKDKTELIQCPGAYSGDYTIPDSVTSIGDDAFYFCESLTSVTIPNSVTTIGDDAFYWCSSLTSIIIPDGVTSIGETAFYSCYNLTNVTIPDSVTSIGSNAFSSTAYFEDYNNWDNGYALYIGKHLIMVHEYATAPIIKNDTLTIADFAFGNCYNLTSVTIPNSVTTIGYQAFSGCYNLTSVTIGDSVTSIGEATFYDCTSLTSVTIPDSVTIIGDSAFFWCTSLTGIWVDEANPNYSSDASGVLFNKYKTELIQCGGAYSGDYIIPESVTTIADYAFCGRNSLMSVMMPDSVMTIGERAFSGCDSLTGIWVDEANPNYSSDASGVLFNKDKTELIQCGGAYSGDYTIPSSVTTIGDSAFESCVNLTSVTMANSVSTISSMAFYDCTGLTDVYFGGAEDEWNAISTFEYNDYLLAATIHYNCTYDEPSEEPSEPSVEPSEPSEEPSEPSEEPSEPSEEPTEPSEEPTEPSEEPSEPSEEPSEPSEEPSEPSEETSEPSEESTEPSEEPTEPSEEPSEPEIPTENPFADVKASDYFATPVLWAVGKNITNGMSATSFAPNANCTRGQIVTFLWRACGSPEPTSTKNNFKDVKAGEYYYKAVLWAVENGITTGLSATTFGPNATCTRGQVATFLWRSQGEPAPTSTNNPFSDVKTSDYYFKAVLWAVENNVTQGMGGGKFAPNASCTRGQIVTFLYRAIA